MKKLEQAIDLDRFLGKTKNRVRRIGIELEGGWNKLPPGNDMTLVQRDGSVNLHDETGRYRAGEIQSPPLEVARMPSWVTEFYPQRISSTCGMHVHLSFRTAFAYQKLMNPTYPATIIAYVLKWAERQRLTADHPIWHRLKGSSIYCQHLFSADEQARAQTKDYNQTRPGHRYTVVNYSFGRFETVECRLLPMMATAALAIEAINEVVSVTNAFLAASAKREEKTRSQFVVDEDVLKEERKSFV